jgi:hypothetical protein
MLNLQHRIDLLVQLGEFILENNPDWEEARQRAAYANAWFIPQFSELAAKAIATEFLSRPVLESIATRYGIPEEVQQPKTIGIVMAGNIPLVGFHDWLCVFLSGHNALIKPSGRDNILFRFLLTQMYQWEVTIQNQTGFAEMLKGCDAYIATGSDNSARYFDYYFGKYPHIIRRNRTSVAILDGTETGAELEKLADDTHLYFGLGCRNVTKLYVPAEYSFEPLLDAMRKYGYFFEHSKYKNNYDYQLAIHLLNNQYYMTNGSILLSENEAVFSPISQLNYSFYTDKSAVDKELNGNNSIQCIVGHGYTPFGLAQVPGWTDYADGVDTMTFLVTL